MYNYSDTMPSRPPLSFRRISVVLSDALVVATAFLCAFALRFEFAIPAEMLDVALSTLPFVLAVYLASFFLCSVYRGIYYFSSFADIETLGKSVALSALITGASILFIRQGRFPRSVLLLQPILVFLGSGGVRFLIRWLKTSFNMPRIYTGRERGVLLIGAGELGESTLRQMIKTPEANYRVVGFLDDDSAKWGLRLHGCPVLGGRAALLGVLERYQVHEIVIAIGAKRGEIVSDVIERMRSLPEKPELKIAPSLMEMLLSPGRQLTFRKVRPIDLLNREAVHLDETRIGGALRGKRVLVTGAGGTIGSELVRQVLRYEPAEVVLIEAHATSLFHIEGEARGKARGARIISILGDIRDRSLVERVFSERRPEVVMHAAAHKHVYQIETNVQEGVLNNALGTYYLCDAAHKNGVQSFLLVSTDKAVKPSSVMGATKRLAEVVVANFAARGQTKFFAVRFGNVLGSSGSVLPIFQEQLEKGGPITVTHPDVRRYFMTVEEAVSLILQGASMAGGGEVFVLKMGEPVRIADMAKNLVLLSGLEPGKDVEIRFTGLKQGEKLDEELYEDPAGCSASEHPDLFVLRGENTVVEELEKKLLDLEIATRGTDSAAVIRRLSELVPTFSPDPAHTRAEA